MSGKLKPIEVITLNETDQSMAPPRFVNQKGGELPTLATQFIWTNLFDGISEKPYWYIRAFYPGAPSSRKIISIGDDMNSPHTIMPVTNKLPVGGKCIFSTVQGDPEEMSDDKQTYEVRLEGVDDFLLRYSSKMAHIIDGDVVDLRLKYFPNSIVLTEESAARVPYLLTFAEAEGMVDGKYYKGMGGSEQAFFYPSEAAGLSAYEVPPMLTFHLLGALEDGRTEYAFIQIFDKDRGSLGVYWREGEGYEITDDVKFRAEWKKVDFVNDGTVSLVKADFKLGSKTIHYTTEYGFRGLDDPFKAPRGLYNAQGTYYVGDKPYKVYPLKASYESQHFTEDFIIPNSF